MIVDIHTHNAHTHARTLRCAGIHPWHAQEGNTAFIESEVDKIDAVGEIGLDYACDTPREAQINIFKRQLALAEKYQKGVVLHCVRAFEDTMREVKNYKLPFVIFHGFIGSVEQAQRAVNEGYYLSFGERTYRSAKTITALRATPLSHIFVESDESTTPIESIYERIAELRGISVADLTKAVRSNFERIL